MGYIHGFYRGKDHGYVWDGRSHVGAESDIEGSFPALVRLTSGPFQRILARVAVPLFDPLALRLWRLAEAAPAALREVHVVHARDAPRHDAAGRDLRHRHAVPTTVVPLADVVRLRTARGDLDLHPGAMAVIAPAAWHAHLPLRPGAAMYTQGLVFGKSDLFFSTGESRRFIALLPAQPAERLLRGLLAAVPEDRLRLGRELLTEVVATLPEQEQVPPAVWRMAYLLWQNLDQPQRAERILAVSGLGQRQALRLFTATFGCGPKRVIRQQQMALAAAMLGEGLPLDTVVAETGFPDRRSFNRAWRQAHAQGLIS